MSICQRHGSPKNALITVRGWCNHAWALSGSLLHSFVFMSLCAWEYRILVMNLLCKYLLSPPWPSGLKRWNQTLVPVVRARFEPRCGRPHFAPTRSGVRVCGRNRTEAREREWAAGTVSSLPGTLNVQIKFCHSTGIARSGGGVRASTTSYALVKALIPRIRPSKHSN